MGKTTKKTIGEIATEATTNGRRITLDPLRTKQLSIAAREVESTIPCGFRQNWVDGKTPSGKEFTIEVGAGVGSRWLTFEYDGRSFCIDIEDIARALVDFADETAPKKVQKKV